MINALCYILVIESRPFLFDNNDPISHSSHISLDRVYSRSNISFFENFYEDDPEILDRNKSLEYNGLFQTPFGIQNSKLIKRNYSLLDLSRDRFNDGFLKMNYIKKVNPSKEIKGHVSDENQVCSASNCNLVSDKNNNLNSGTLSSKFKSKDINDNKHSFNFKSQSDNEQSDYIDHFNYYKFFNKINNLIDLNKVKKIDQSFKHSDFNIDSIHDDNAYNKAKMIDQSFKHSDFNSGSIYDDNTYKKSKMINQSLKYPGNILSSIHDDNTYSKAKMVDMSLKYPETNHNSIHDDSYLKSSNFDRYFSVNKEDSFNFDNEKGNAFTVSRDICDKECSIHWRIWKITNQVIFLLLETITTTS